MELISSIHDEQSPKLCIFSSFLRRFCVSERKVLVERKGKWLPDNVLVPKHIPGFCNSAWAVGFSLPRHFQGSTMKAVNFFPVFCLFVYFARILFKVCFHLLLTSTCINQFPQPEIKEITETLKTHILFS